MLSSLRSAAKNCTRKSISKYFGRSFATNVSENGPCKGDKGAFQLALGYLTKSSHSVVVGMSGGVDSSVAAFLLAQQVKMLLSPYVTNRF